jgi:hypothetical protein
MYNYNIILLNTWVLSIDKTYTSSGNSSLTSVNIREVFPTPAVKEKYTLTNYGNTVVFFLI